MRRRHGLLSMFTSGVLVLLAQPLRAQPARKMHRVGVLGPDTSDGEGLVWANAVKFCTRTPKS